MRKKWKKSVALFLTSALLISSTAALPAFASSALEASEQNAKSKEEKAVTAKPSAGTYNKSQKVSLTASKKDAQIYYTKNGKTPTEKSSKYDAKKKITVSRSMTLKAIAIGKDGKASDVVSIKYVIDKNAKAAVLTEEEQAKAAAEEQQAKAADTASADEEKAGDTSAAEEKDEETKTVDAIALSMTYEVGGLLADAFKTISVSTENIGSVDIEAQSTDDSAVIEAGESYAITCYVTLEKGYAWASDAKATLNDSEANGKVDGSTAAFTFMLKVPAAVKEIGSVALTLDYTVGNAVSALKKVASSTAGIGSIETVVSPADGVITAGTSYSISCTITAADGYTWNTSASENKATLNASISGVCSSVKDDAATFLFTLAVPAATASPTTTNTPTPTTTAKTKITSVAVAGLTFAERGNTPDMSVKKASSVGGYTVSKVYWREGSETSNMSSSAIFQPNTKYTAYIKLKAKDGYKFDTSVLAVDTSNKNDSTEIDGTAAYIVEASASTITLARAWLTESAATASTSSNTITGLSSSYTTSSTISFTMNGASNDAVEGNERYIPTSYEVSSQSYTVSEGTASVTKSIKISSAGTYTLKVTFQKQTYDTASEKWVNVDGTTDTKTATIKVTTASTSTTSATKTTTATSTATATTTSSASSASNAKTSDETPVEALIFIFLLAGALIVALVYRKKKA